MPLIRTPEGVRVLRDWSPERIGRAFREAVASSGESADAIQAALLRRPARPLDEPVPVPVSDEVEKLVRFLNH